MNNRILIVDDDDDFREFLVTAFETSGFKVSGAVDSIEGIKALNSGEFDLVISDFYMPKGNGVEFLERIKELDKTTPVVILTAFSDKEILSNALKSGAVNFIDKSISLQNLISYVSSMLTLFSSTTLSNRVDRELRPHIECYRKELVLASNEKILSRAPQMMVNDLLSMELITEEESMQCTIMLVEALSNALYHGNLEVDSSIRDNSFSGQKSYKVVITERQNDPKYMDRKIRFLCSCSESEIIFEIEDDGPGFDWRKKREVNLSSGRGFLIISSFSDEVIFNEKGNMIKIVKRRK